MTNTNPSIEADASGKILVIEDDRSLREGLAMNLRMQSYNVVMAADGEEGMRMAFDERPDLIILDLMMPCWSGLDILDELRRRGENMPVLILSARHTTPDKVQGLSLGADDYMTKPFDLPELLARVQAMLRRRRGEQKMQPKLILGDLEINRSTRSVRFQNRPISLSAKEFDLLCLLANAPGQVFRREAILEQVWGWDYEGTERTVDNFVAHLRKKLGRRKIIHTIPRVGYKIELGPKGCSTVEH